MNKKYSFKDFSDKSLKKVDAKELSNSDIIGSCFYQQENPDADIFPNGMTGVTFINCNLDNVLIPEGNTIGTGNTNKKLKTQNDLCLWVLDKDKKPKEPLDKIKFEKLKLSIKPKDIPKDKTDKNIIQAEEEKLKEEKESAVEKFKEDYDKEVK